VSAVTAEDKAVACDDDGFQQTVPANTFSQGDEVRVGVGEGSVELIVKRGWSNVGEVAFDTED
jgi:hypothetical protein